MKDEERYSAAQEQAEREWEARCNNCGACCGATDDPCEQLRRREDGLFYCNIYADRLGQRRTLGGKVFHCIPVRIILHLSWPGDERCSYKTSVPPPFDSQ